VRYYTQEELNMSDGINNAVKPVIDLPFYPYGLQYYRQPTPLPAEWEADLSDIVCAGYTHIQLRPQWRWHERVRGAFDWDDIDKLFELASKYSLKVILKPMLETAPDWVYTELNGTRIGFHGIPVSPIAHGAFYVGGWLPCFDNPMVMDAACNFVENLVERYKSQNSLWLYNAWNEPRSRPLGQCMCRHSVESYQKWLSKRYGCIKALNHEFGKAWTSFSSISPPHSGCDYAEMYLWRQWAAESVAGHVGRVADTIRMADDGRRIMAHVGACSVIQDAACDSSDDLLTAHNVDFYGTSLPVNLHPHGPIEWAGPEFIADWLRRVDGNWWCHEFYPNHGNWCPPPEPNKLRQMIWMAISGGARGFTYWQYRSERLGNETNGYGLREIDGTSNERSMVADEIADILRDKSIAFSQACRLNSPIALLYSRESDILSRIELMQNLNAMQEDINTSYPYKTALRNAHALYLQSGFTTDFAVPGDDISCYKVLHIAGAEMLQPEYLEWLHNFVSGGGVLVIEYPFACRDKNTWVSPQRPSGGYAHLLGCREASRTTIDTESLQVSFYNSTDVKSKGWKVVLQPVDCKVIARWTDGSAAAVHRRLGQGHVYTLGCGISLSHDGTWNYPGADALTKILADSAGLSPLAQKGVWHRRLIKPDGEEVLFVYNLNDFPAYCNLDCNIQDTWASHKAQLKDNLITLQANGIWIGRI
jgi:beta-galactosidase GanA